MIPRTHCEMKGRRSKLASVAKAGALLCAWVAISQSVLAWMLPTAPVMRGLSATGRQHSRSMASRSSPTGSAIARASSGESWILPTVDKDVADFKSGSGTGYAWVQTSETLYIFAEVPERANEDSLKVILEPSNEGHNLHFAVEGQDIINGQLANAIKPGTEIWMVEEAGDGKSFVVVELDKTIPGREWASVMLPTVDFIGDYSHIQVVSKPLTEQDKVNTVEATLEHLRKMHVRSALCPDEHTAKEGDALFIDMAGFERAEDGSRGAPLNIGAASNMEIELGKPGGGLTAAMHAQLVGIKAGETRDLEAKLGNRAGAMGGQSILLAVTCNKMYSQELPALDDLFAREVKRNDQFRQAGTAEGIPEEEEDTANAFTMAALRAEIEDEVERGMQTEYVNNIHSQLQQALIQKARVNCEWAAVDPESVEGEKQAAIMQAVVDREGLEIDIEEVKRTSWDELATPKGGERVAEVGKDPDRDFQREFIKFQRKAQLEKVISFLESRAELVDELEAQ